MVSGTLVLTDAINRRSTTSSRTRTRTRTRDQREVARLSTATRREPPSIPARSCRRCASCRMSRRRGIVSDDSATKILDRKGKAIDDGRRADLRLRHRLAAAAVQPAEADDRALGEHAERGGDRRRDGRRPELQGRRHRRVATLKPVRPFKLVGIAQYGTSSSIGSATFADLHDARRPRSSSTAKGSSTRSRSRRSPASRRSSSSRRSSRSCR